MKHFALTAVLFAATAFVSTASAARDLGSPTGLQNTQSTGVLVPVSPTEALPNETFEAFPTGNLPINGWTSNFNDNFTIVDTTTIAGTRSWRHTSDFSGFADTGTAPAFPAYYGYLGSQVRIDAAASGSLYQWIPLGDVLGTGGGAYFNTRINLNPNGTIEALQVAGGVGVFAPTTGTFTSGETFSLGVSVNAAGVLQVYKNNAVIFTGQDIAFALTGTAGRLAGHQQYAANAATGGASTMTLDNFTSVVPEPTTLAALAGAGLFGLTRRR